MTVIFRNTPARVPLLFLFILHLSFTPEYTESNEEALDPERESDNGVLETMEASHTEKRRLQLRVLTYNVQDLPWPLRPDGDQAMERIGRELRRMREDGSGPHLVFLQEGFTDSVERLISLAGFPYSIRGPGASDPAPAASPYLTDKFHEARRLTRGEGWGKWIGSGLHILSDYPIVEQSARPFSRDACAGWDCLANKGALFARIELPGLPEPLQVFTTHLNSRMKAGVSEQRSRAAHMAQARELKAFLETRIDPALPLIFGGDFNTMHAPARFDHLELQLGFPVLRKFCAQETVCSIDLPDDKTPWLKTQDLQGFEPGRKIGIRPLRAESILDQTIEGERLSDHDGYLVTYELHWQEEDTRAERTAVPFIRYNQGGR